MADENDQPPISKLTRTKQRWAREGNRGYPWAQRRYSGD
jgi:hypothetical protein